jgi:hypothetical protein
MARIIGPLPNVLDTPTVNTDLAIQQRENFFQVTSVWTYLGRREMPLMKLKGSSAGTPMPH